MRIALLTDGVHPFVIGGMQRHSAYLAKFLSLRGHHLTLVHCVAWKDKIPSEEAVRKALEINENIAFESVVIRFPKPGFLPGHYLKESYIFSKLIFEKLAGNLNEFDFIYAKGFCAWHLLHLKSKGEKMPPIGLKFHGYEMFQKDANLVAGLKSWMLRGAVKWNNLQADLVFSYGGHITEIIRELGVADNRIIEVPSGIDVSWLRAESIKAPAEKRKMLFIGRSERRKGIVELHIAISKLVAISNAEFHLIGPIPPSIRLKNPSVFYHGPLSDSARIQAIMDECQVLVVPSYSEGMPNVIMEGMSRGMAIIASDVGAVSIQVNDHNGWLIEPGNQEQLFETMKVALELDAESMLSLQNRSMTVVREKFLWPDVASNLEAALLERINPSSGN